MVDKKTPVTCQSVEATSIDATKASLMREENDDYDSDNDDDNKY